MWKSETVGQKIHIRDQAIPGQEEPSLLYMLHYIILFTLSAHKFSNLTATSIVWLHKGHRCDVIVTSWQNICDIIRLMVVLFCVPRKCASTCLNFGIKLQIIDLIIIINFNFCKSRQHHMHSKNTRSLWCHGEAWQSERLNTPWGHKTQLAVILLLIILIQTLSCVLNNISSSVVYILIVILHGFHPFKFSYFGWILLRLLFRECSVHVIAHMKWSVFTWSWPSFSSTKKP